MWARSSINLHITKLCSRLFSWMFQNFYRFMFSAQHHWLCFTFLSEIELWWPHPNPNPERKFSRAKEWKINTLVLFLHWLRKKKIINQTSKDLFFFLLCELEPAWMFKALTQILWNITRQVLASSQPSQHTYICTLFDLNSSYLCILSYSEFQQL